MAGCGAVSGAAPEAGSVGQSTPPAVASAQGQFGARWQRLMDCVNLKQPDRMPVGFLPTFWLAKYGGISCRELMYDYDKARALTVAACREFQPDIASPSTFVALGPLLDATGFRQVNWPGHGVGDHQTFQYIDREYMSADEYDEFLFDPTGFYLDKYLPRVASIYQGLRPLGSLAGACYFDVVNATGMFAAPQMRQTLAQLTAAGEENERYARNMAALAEELAVNGFPLGFGVFAEAPYDFVADYLRGATGMMKDLYRHRDKLLQVIDKVRILHVRKVLAAARLIPNPFVFIPIHWAPDAFMSQKQFETFWWPSFRRMLLDLIEAKLIPLVMWESDCTRRLETIRDIPPGKCVYWFERTDMVRAFEVLGDVVALRGNISPSVMTTGSPQDVDAAVKNLVDRVWNPGGKLILDCAFGVPDETPVENVRAMFAAARKYAG